MQLIKRGVSTGSGRRTFFGFSLRRAGIVTFVLGLLCLAGCRIVVQVPEGGQVVSDQGLLCAAGDTCVIGLVDSSYLKSFDAVAATGNALSVRSLYSDTYGYGLRNFLSWMVDDWQYDTPYTVTISNVQMPDGSVRNIEYPVEIDFAEFN